VKNPATIYELQKALLKMGFNAQLGPGGELGVLQLMIPLGTSGNNRVVFRSEYSVERGGILSSLSVHTNAVWAAMAEEIGA
jgi:hypothetical protein